MILMNTFNHSCLQVLWKSPLRYWKREDLLLPNFSLGIITHYWNHSWKCSLNRCITSNQRVVVSEVQNTLLCAKNSKRWIKMISFFNKWCNPSWNQAIWVVLMSKLKESAFNSVVFIQKDALRSFWCSWNCNWLFFNFWRNWHNLDCLGGNVNFFQRFYHVSENVFIGLIFHVKVCCGAHRAKKEDWSNESRHLSIGEKNGGKTDQSTVSWAKHAQLFSRYLIWGLQFSH